MPVSSAAGPVSLKGDTALLAVTLRREARPRRQCAGAPARGDVARGRGAVAVRESRRMSGPDDNLPGVPLPQPPAGFWPTVRRDLRRGVIAGLQTFWDLAKVMIPAYGVTLALQQLGVIGRLSDFARPLMTALGLPGDAAVPLVVGYVLNIYAAVGSMQALDLTPQQVTVLAIAVLIGHNLVVEGAVLHKAGMNGFAFGALRIVAGLAAAIVANLLMGLFS
jgi:hypothetical protein